jgi:hypothetical protein
MWKRKNRQEDDGKVNFCECVCVSAREGERKRARKKERKREGREKIKRERFRENGKRTFKLDSSCFLVG